MHRKELHLLVAALSLTTLNASDTVREHVVGIVTQIQRADYEGNRANLKQDYIELAPFVDDADIGSRVRYWRGFALWRRAINGFNDSAEPAELEQDLKQAIDEFKAVTDKEPGFADAKVGMISCWGFLAYMKRGDAAAVQPIVERISPLVKEAKAAAADNPRLRWVLGPILFYQARSSGTVLQTVIENYQQGLQHCPESASATDKLQPSWGRPELLMSLAYTYLNDTPPDLEAAERNARGALELVPYWHYTRDILLPQILAAKTKLN